MSRIHPAEPDRVSLAQLPTPVVPAPRLGKHAGDASLLIKRDDLTGLELTGNKIRKLEYLIADALAQGCDTLVTHGGFQSNHCRATAAAGARLGLRVRMFLRSADSSPAKDGNLFLDELFGAAISFHTPHDYNTNRNSIIDKIMTDERSAGRKPYFFPVGASVPLGCWGYARCMRELSEQIDPRQPLDLFVPVSSSGTYAGCVLGKALLKLDAWRIVGIPVSDSVDYFHKDAQALLAATVQAFRLPLSPDQLPLEFLSGYIGDGYAIPYEQALQALRDAARLEGLLLDPTYTSKALWGTLDSITNGRVRSGATPLFLHTGGSFGLMARRDLF
jgi:D-cysteine desulfhydrase